MSGIDNPKTGNISMKNNEALLAITAHVMPRIRVGISLEDIQSGLLARGIDSKIVKSVVLAIAIIEEQIDIGRSGEYIQKLLVDRGIVRSAAAANTFVSGRIDNPETGNISMKNIIFNNGPYSGSSGIAPILEELFRSRGVRCFQPDNHVIFLIKSFSKDRPIFYWSHQDLCELLPYVNLSNWKIVHMYRDPRDVAISLFHDPLFKSAYTTMASSITRAAVWSDWACDAIKMPDVMLITFEEMKESIFDTIQRIIKYAEITDIPQHEIQMTCEKYSYETITDRPRGEDGEHLRTGLFLRKGISGDWKTGFTSDDRMLAKKLMGSALVTLGFEKDLNW